MIGIELFLRNKHIPTSQNFCCKIAILYCWNSAHVTSRLESNALVLVKNQSPDIFHWIFDSFRYGQNLCDSWFRKISACTAQVTKNLLILFLNNEVKRGFLKIYLNYTGYHRPPDKMHLLSPAYVFCGKVMFSVMSVCLFTGVPMWPLPMIPSTT